MRKFVNAVWTAVLYITLLACGAFCGALFGGHYDAQNGHDDPVGNGVLIGAIVALIVTALLLLDLRKKIVRIDEQDTDGVAVPSVEDVARLRLEERRERLSWKQHWQQSYCARTAEPRRPGAWPTTS